MKPANMRKKFSEVILLTKTIKQMPEYLLRASEASEQTSRNCVLKTGHDTKSLSHVVWGHCSFHSVFESVATIGHFCALV